MDKEKQQIDREKHEFKALPEFDKAMRRIVAVPKDEVDKRFSSKKRAKRRKK